MPNGYPRLSTHPPIHNEGVRQHFLVAALALLQRRLKAAGENLSTHAALCVLATVRLVEFEAVEGARKRVVTIGTEQSRTVLKIPRMPPPKALAQVSGTAEGTNAVTILE